MSNWGDYENEIYGQGLVGVAPTLPMSYADWEAHAQQALPPGVLSYVAGGSVTSTPSAPTWRPSSIGG